MLDRPSAGERCALDTTQARAGRRSEQSRSMNITSPSVATGVMLAGKYRIERTIGEGGMGVVLAATNEALRQRDGVRLLHAGSQT